MAVAKFYPSSYSGGTFIGAWNYPSRLYAEDGNYASISSATTGVYLFLSGFDFSAIPDGSTINSVKIETKGRRLNTQSESIYFDMRYNQVRRGPSFTLALTTTNTVYQNTDCGAWTLAELKSGLVSIYLNPATTYSEWDYASVIVDYTPPAAPGISQII